MSTRFNRSPLLILFVRHLFESDLSLLLISITHTNARNTWADHANEEPTVRFAFGLNAAAGFEDKRY